MHALRQLSISTYFFREDLGLWVETGVIRGIVQILKKVGEGMGGTKGEEGLMAAKVLQDFFYYSEPDSPLVKMVFEYDFIQDLVELCRYSDDAIDYYELINSILNGR